VVLKTLISVIFFGNDWMNRCSPRPKFLRTYHLKKSRENVHLT